MFAIDSLSRRLLLTLMGSALALTACGGDDSKPSIGADGEYTVEGDYILGEADAPVTLVEYASVACGGCAYWHENVYPDLKSKYISTGKVKYVFRPFPASTPEIATTGHKLAYCAPRDKFFKNIDLQFEAQPRLFKAAQQGRLRQAYVSLAKASGLSEDEFIACLTDEEITKRYERDTQLGVDMGVTGTPSVFVNGVKTDGSDLEAIEKLLLPALGEDVPVSGEGAAE